MKKWLSYMLSVVMMFCLLTGCGGGGGTTAEPEKEGVAKGYWVVEKMVMEGNEFDKETMEGIFGEAESIMALAFDGEGGIDGIYFGEPLKGTYTGAEDALEMDLMGEKATGVCMDDIDFTDLEVKHRLLTGNFERLAGAGGEKVIKQMIHTQIIQQQC